MNKPQSYEDLQAAPAADDQRAFAQFVAAIAQGDDEKTELLSQELTTAHEAALIELASADSPEEAWWALRGLALVGGAPSVATLVRALSAPQSEFRQAAALALGRLYARTPSTIVPHLSALAALLADEDGMVRQLAMAALSLCGDDAVAALAEVLAGSNQGARSRATQALRNIGSMHAAPILYRYLEDPNHLVRTHAYAALDEMGLLENILVTL